MTFWKLVGVSYYQIAGVLHSILSSFITRMKLNFKVVHLQQY